jgi:uncharacterized membrane protein YbaN (DUF454 family)
MALAGTVGALATQFPGAGSLIPAVFWLAIEWASFHLPLQRSRRYSSFLRCFVTRGASSQAYKTSSYAWGALQGRCS